MLMLIHAFPDARALTSNKLRARSIAFTSRDILSHARLCVYTGACCSCVACHTVRLQLSIAHRDLKAENVLVRATAVRGAGPVRVAADSLAVADYGLCHAEDDGDGALVVCVSVNLC